MINPQQGNRIILLLFAIALAVAAFFVQWGVVTITAEDLRESVTINGQKAGDDVSGLFGSMMTSMFSGMKVPVSGSNGNLVLGPLKIPYWLAILSVIIGLLLTVTNSLQVSAIPRKLILGLLAVGVVCGLWALVVLLTNGSIGLGSLLLVAASIIGFTQQRPLHS